MSTPLDIASQLCQHFEGFRSAPYKCPAGVWTIGYGTVFKPDGSKVSPDDPAVTEPTAKEWLEHTLMATYVPSVVKASPVLAAYPRVWGALADFAYNLGPARYRASTLRKRIEAEDWEEAAYELSRWVRSGGRVLRGLVLRRAAEAAYLPQEAPL